MKIFASLIFFWAVTAQAACRFHPAYGKIYSLSGPVTQILEEWNLLQAKELKGASLFYPLPGNFKGEKIPGGVFLSPSKLDEMKNALVFFDESQELRKLFRTRRVNAVEILSRNQTPGEVTASVLKTLKKYVTGCDSDQVLAKVRTLEQSIEGRMKGKPSIIFFLGEIRKEKLPEFVIANDGLVLWLKRKNLISSYPSELGYVNWAGSIIEALKGKSLFLGIREEDIPTVSGNSRKANLAYPGGLIPGIRQLKAWNYFLDHQPR